ncbi:MAG: D-2-hydroxyacid dehydrogenase [Weeksellaceae bacterium]|jgi:D-3-phosphoglycerate dehydrogenase|nr:D-2-hydroxyacid dehydrogenase [Weeksellaceae bacterium]
MKILANDGISLIGKKTLEKKGFQVFTQTVPQENLSQYIQDNEIEVLLVRSATKVRQELIDSTDLKLIGRGGVGMDNIDVEYARSKGITVINTPASSSASVAEMVMAHSYSIYRNLHQTNRSMPLEGDSQFKELKKAYSSAFELAGKTMGIIGFGRIGQAVAKAAIGAGMKVIAYDLFVEKATITLDFFDGRSLDFTISTQSFDEVLKHSDIISLHVPSQSKYLISFAEFEKMKDRAVLINTARGGVVDEKALLTTLESGKLLGAALDVFEEEPTPSVFLLMNDALSLSPHLAGNTIEAQERIGLELAQQIIDFYEK